MHKLVVRLKGGLGNQMFQYANGRALAIRRGATLVLDTKSGFARDRVYRRTYSLGRLPVKMRPASWLERGPFWYERSQQKLFRRGPVLLQRRPWGTYVNETEGRFFKPVFDLDLERDTYIEGYWQSEAYFAGESDVVQNDFILPEPTEPKFRAMGETIRASNSVSVGVRLFEEVPGKDKAGVGGLVPYSFYAEAAAAVAKQVSSPVFFVFSTTDAGVRDRLELPGPVHYLTHDNGYVGELARLWLISQCAHHVVSNSSFYWWGAWLAERRNSDSVVIASDQFANKDTIPSRWETI